MKKINIQKLADWRPFAFLPGLLDQLQLLRYGWSDKIPTTNGTYLVLSKLPDGHNPKDVLEVQVEVIGDVKMKRDVVYVNGYIGGMQRRCDADFLISALKRCYWKQSIP